MRKKVTHPLLAKGSKRFKLSYFLCHIGIHSMEIDDCMPSSLKQEDKNVGRCNLILYYCSKCGKQELIADNILLCST